MIHPDDIHDNIEELCDLTLRVREAAECGKQLLSYSDLEKLQDMVFTLESSFHELREVIPQPRQECDGCSSRTLADWRRMPQDSVSGGHRNNPLSDAASQLIQIAKNKAAS